MFLDTPRSIEKDKLALVWLSRSSVKPVWPSDTQDSFNTRFGPFKYTDMIGQPFGQQLGVSSGGPGYVHVLRPTPELWSLSLSHRTQIVYTPDASYIVQRLGVRGGSHVIETGTGSGSFTHSLARTVGRRGRVFSYEFHQARFDEARDEFSRHGLDGVVRVALRDVCVAGFGPGADTDTVDTDTADTDTGSVTAVFLDLPSPWQAVRHVPKAVSRKQNVQLSAFSPCIEQVSQTIQALEEAGFTDIEIVEVRARKWEAHWDMVRDVGDAVRRLENIRVRRECGLANRHKRQFVDPESRGAEPPPAAVDPPPEFNPWGKGQRVRPGDEGYQWRAVSRPEAELKSHTSYLTFARLPPTQRRPSPPL